MIFQIDMNILWIDNAKCPHSPVNVSMNVRPKVSKSMTKEAIKNNRRPHLKFGSFLFTLAAISLFIRWCPFCSVGNMCVCTLPLSLRHWLGCINVSFNDVEIVAGMGGNETDFQLHRRLSENEWNGEECAHKKRRMKEKRRRRKFQTFSIPEIIRPM